MLSTWVKTFLYGLILVWLAPSVVSGKVTDCESELTPQQQFSLRNAQAAGFRYQLFRAPNGQVIILIEEKIPTRQAAVDTGRSLVNNFERRAVARSNAQGVFTQIRDESMALREDGDLEGHAYAIDDNYICQMMVADKKPHNLHYTHRPGLLEKCYNFAQRVDLLALTTLAISWISGFPFDQLPETLAMNAQAGIKAFLLFHYAQQSGAFIFEKYSTSEIYRTVFGYANAPRESKTDTIVNNLIKIANEPADRRPILAAVSRHYYDLVAMKLRQELQKHESHELRALP